MSDDSNSGEEKKYMNSGAMWRKRERKKESRVTLNFELNFELVPSSEMGHAGEGKAGCRSR